MSSCPCCKTDYELGRGGPLYFICKNPACPYFDKPGVAEFGDDPPDEGEFGAAGSRSVRHRDR